MAGQGISAHVDCQPCFGEVIAADVTERNHRFLEEALELVTDLVSRGSDIPIVISDQLMPGLKGNELLKLIHEISPGTYTVLLTGQSDLHAVTDAVNFANLYRYIAKHTVTTAAGAPNFHRFSRVRLPRFVLSML